MGIGNVTLIQTTWAHLPDQQHRLAVYIGRIARDVECEFYGGRELLAIGLGKQVPKAPADDDESDNADEARKVRKATFEAVRRCLRELEAAGVIELIRRPSPGKPAKYKVNPLCNNRPESVWPVTGQSQSGPSTGPTDQSESGPSPTPTGQTQSAQRARPTVPTGQTQSADGPDSPWGKEEEDVIKDSSGGSSGEATAPGTGTRGRASDPAETTNGRGYWQAVARAALRGEIIEPDDPELEETHPPDEASA